VQRLLFTFVLYYFFSLTGYSQTVTQIYTDRCTNESKVVTATFINGSATVAFYDRIKTFTWVEYTNGTLKAWLDETYAYWANLSPCSINNANNQTTQQTATTTIANAGNAATNATNSYDTTSQTTNTDTSVATSNTGTENTSSSTESTSSQMDSSQESSGTTTGSESSNEAETGTGETETQTEQQESTSETTEESQQTDEQSQEESQQEETQEQETEETSENEESTTEEGTEEESENDDGDGEESEEEVEEEEEKEIEEEEEESEEEKEEEKNNPINVIANVLTQSTLDGILSNALNIGFSQSSLTGKTTYSANLMLWGNLKQFSLGLSKSDVYFNYDKEEKLYLLNPETNKKDLYLGSVYSQGTINNIQTLSVNFMSMYGTKSASFGISNVFMGQKDNFWKGFVGGYALLNRLINIDNTLILMPSGVLFGTKPFPTKKVIISPTVALALNPISYSFNTKNVFKGNFVFNEHITYVVGSNFDVNLSQRFTFNVGGNVIGSTLPGIPLTWSTTIGSRFQF
jgi:hypothetical protein